MTKLQLVNPWPSDRHPPTTASLLSIASKAGLVAAADPEKLIVGSTESVRNAYFDNPSLDGKVKPYTPQASIQIPRVNQVVFSSDESSLVIAAEEGGGLAVYDVQALQQGNQQPAFQMSTNGISVRALVPNPAPEVAHLFAVVLTDGKLMIADLKARQLVNGTTGQVFCEGVSCVSWSAKGKQLVAGLADGTAVQYDPLGNIKAHIPKPPLISGDLPVTTICWIANDDFLTIHTPLTGDDTDSTYHILHRDKASGNFSAYKFTGDPCPGFGLRSPANHYISRLRAFPPNLEDMLILSSTAAVDVGLFTKSSAPLTRDVPADRIINTYTTTTMSIDNRRPLMPMSTDGMGDTSPIGMALDLSATNVVPRPIPDIADQVEDSHAPLPALMLLTNEGILVTWWVVYNDSIIQKTAFPGLVSPVAVSAPPSAPSSAPTDALSPIRSFGSTALGKPPSVPAFGSSSFGKPTATPAFGSPSTPGSFGQPTAGPAFGAASTPGAFGKPASAPAFGSVSTPGFGGASALTQKSPWGTPAPTSSPSTSASNGTGKPVFGSNTPMAATSGNTGFGAVGGLGKRESPWGGPPKISQESSGSTFGKPSAFGGATASAPSGFAQLGISATGSALSSPSKENKPEGSPFSAFASSKPFSSLTGGAASDANKPTPPVFAGFASKPSPLGSSFGKPSDTTQPSFASTVTLPSSTGGSFGSAATIGPKTSPWTTPAVSREDTMVDEGEDSPAEPQSAEKPKPAFGQPSEKPQQSAFGKLSEKPAAQSPFSNFKLGSTFQPDKIAKDNLSAPAAKSGFSFGSGFSNMLGEVANEKPKEPVTPIKKEPGLEEPKLQDISTTPLPSDQPEKSAEMAAGTEKTIETDDAPLPPDFTTFKTKPAEEDLPPIAGSPPIDLGEESSEDLSPPASSHEEDEEEEEEEEEEDDEEGEEDDGSWEEESASTSETRPGPSDDKPTSDFASRLTFPSQNAATSTQNKPVVPSTTPAGLPKAPFFAPPTKTQESPRSPSPVRPTTGRSQSRQAAAQPIAVPPLGTQRRSSSRQSSAMQSQKLPQPPPAPEAGELSDAEDARVHEILDSEVEPTKDLDAFIAHQDYLGQVSKPGIGGQIEKVFRDINSMIDTLGMNARSLQAFVSGHESLMKQGERERSDLEDADEWCLVEIDDLDVVERNIGKDLESGKVNDVKEKMAELGNLYKEASRLRGKTAEMRKHIASRADPQQRANARAAPLGAEAQTQQTELRQAVTKVQKLLQEAEEALSVLRADLASIPANGTSTQRTPTVEAVANTILKMTAMIEQKSGDVDVLEAQIRRLPRGLADLSLEDETDVLRSSTRTLNGGGRSSSPYRTPPASRGRMAANGTPLGLSGMLGHRFKTPQHASRMSISMSKSQSGTYGLTYSPDSSSDFGRSSVTGSARKKMTDVTPEEVQRYTAKVQQRRKVLSALKDTVEKRGTRITKVEK